MYADRVDASQSKSVMDRIDGNSSTNSSRSRQITRKRQRQDDKWEHDLYEDEPQLSGRRVGGRDLRMKLQKKGLQSASQSRNVASSGVRDLREKLSGTLSSRAVNAAQPKPKILSESAKQTLKSVAVEGSVPRSKNNSNPPREKIQQKESVDSFLQSLDLEKYLITFQAEEVDMTALLHMTDEDLKALGIPMGPRKKILLALESRC